MNNKYNEIMDRVKVDAEMRERILMALEQESQVEREEGLLSRDELVEEEKKDNSPTEAGEAGEKREFDSQKELPESKDEKRKKNGNRRLSFFGRMNRISAAIAAILALVLIGSGVAYVSLKSGDNMSLNSSMMAEEAAMDEAAEATEGNADGATDHAVPGESGGAAASDEAAATGGTEAAETDEFKGGILGEAAEEAADEAAVPGAAAEEAANTTADMAKGTGADNLTSPAGGSDVSVDDLIGMVSGNAADYVPGGDSGTSSVTMAAQLAGYDGEVYLEWTDNVIGKVVWTEAGSGASLDEFVELITTEIGEVGKKNEETGAYSWSVNGKKVVLRSDLAIEITKE